MPIQQVGFWRPDFSRLPGDNVQIGTVIPEGGLNWYGRHHQVVLPTFTKLAQGWVDATMKTERLCFHFQDRFEIRGCNTSRGPFYLIFFSINSVNQRKTGIKSAPRFWHFSNSNCVLRELELEALAFFKVVFLCLAIAEISVKQVRYDQWIPHLERTKDLCPLPVSSVLELV